MENSRGLNVLSLFDGRSTGLDSLIESEKKIENYYSSEIDTYAMAISEYNHEGQIIRLGDVNNWKEWDIDWNSIDILLAGFPCQSFSFSGKQLGFEDERGKLAIVTLEILNFLKEKNPNLKFLFENVKMKKEYSDILDEMFGVEHVMIDSNLVTAQNRKRYYWTNLDFDYPEDKGILLKDIIHELNDEILDEKVNNFNVNPSGRGMNGNVYSVNEDKSKTLTTNKGEGQKISVSLNKYIVPFDKTLQILDKEVEKGKLGFFRKDSQGNRVYFVHGKSVTLGAMTGGIAGKSSGLYLFGCITPERINKRQNGQRFNTGRKFYTLTAQDKHGILIEGYIRKLTPIECERLQGTKDNSTKYGLFNGVVKEISDSQRYKVNGNGWSQPVITNFFKKLTPKI